MEHGTKEHKKMRVMSAGSMMMTDKKMKAMMKENKNGSKTKKKY